LSRIVRIGQSNGKQLLKKLYAFGYPEAVLRQALEDE
ncbi:ribonuclease M5, partial [Staphylococcus aureus]|nr:ribonuclease M5 [Staphylococcus aureus]